MATYDYLCLTCGSTTEVRASIAEKQTGLAPVCGGCKSENLRRSFTPLNVASTGSRGTAPSPGPAAGSGGCCGGGCGCG